MVKASIRGASSQLKMATPALHSIILTQNAETPLIQDYFRTKKLQGPRAVPKSILSADVVANLREKLRNCTDMSTCVSCIVMCLEEFSTNHQVQDPWHQFSKELAQLVSECLAYFIEVKRRDHKQNTSNFDDLSRNFTKLCYVIYYFADKSADLSTELFNRCSKGLMAVLISKNLDSEMRAVLLQALSFLCKYAKAHEIVKTFSNLQVYLVCLGKIVDILAVETQMDAYKIFHTSLLNKDDAIIKASTWFSKWPSVRDTFIESYSLEFSKGCGMFLNSLHKLKKASDMKQTPISSCSLTLSTGYTHNNTKPRHSAGLVESNTTISAKKLESATAINNIKKPHKVSFPTSNVAKMQSTTIATSLNESQKSSKGKPFQQTSYYPNSCNSPSLRVDPSKPVRGKQTEQFQKSGRLIFSETTIRGNPDQNPKDISSKKLETQTASIQDGMPFKVPFTCNAANTPSVTPTVGLQKQSKPKVFQTPYYPDSRKSLSLRNKIKKDQNNSVSSKQAEHFERNSELKFLEGPNTQKEEDLNNTPEPKVKKTRYVGKKALQSEPKSKEIEKDVPVQRCSLSNLSSEDHSSKVEKWLSYHDTNHSEDFDTVVISSDDDKIDSYNHKVSGVRETVSQERPAPQRVYHSPPMVSFTSNISHTKTNVKAPSKKNGENYLEKTRPGQRTVDFKTDVTNTGNMSPPVKRKKDNSSGNTEYSVTQPVNMWEKKLRELEQNRIAEKQKRKDIYCFNASVTPAPFKTPRVPATSRKTRSKTGPSACQQVKTQKSSKNKRSDILANKENCKTISQSIKINKNPGKPPLSRINNCLQPTETEKKEKKKMKYTKDLSLNPTGNGKIKVSCTSPTNNSELVGSSNHYFSPVVDDSFEMKAGMEEKVKVSPIQTESCKTKKQSDLSEFAKEKPKSCTVFDKNMTTVKSEKTPFKHIFNNSNQSESYKDVKGVKTYFDSKGKDILGDSGFEVTSGSDGGSKFADETVSAVRKNKHSSKSEYYKSFLQTNLKKALEANADILSGNESMATEMNEIQNFAQKISESASRCILTNRSNCQQLRDQHSALQGCSNYLGPYEDQTFKALVPGTRYLDFKAFTRHLKEQSRQRTMNAIREALEKSFSSSSSGDEL